MLARVRGDTALSALSTEGTSMPVIVIAGPDHPRAESAAADERQAREHLGELPELVLAVAGPGPFLTPEPLHRHVAVRVVQRRERVEEHDQRVRCGASVLAGVLRADERLDLDRRHRRAPECDRERGHPGRTLPMSAMSIASDRNSSGCVWG